MREAMNHNSAMLLTIMLLVLVQWESVSGSGLGCREDERRALLQIKAALPLLNKYVEGEWEGNECCRWERVTCDANTGHVTELDLYNYDYYNSYNSSLLNGTIFLPLSQLRSLSLYGQQISGFMAGSGLETWSNLTKLEIIDLSFNHLNGSITFPLARISSLRELVLSGSFREDNTLHTKGFESWSNLTKLEMLDLSSNKLNKSIISSIAAVKSLRALYLENNNIEGNLPYLGDWSSLQTLSLAANYLNGTSISKGFESWSNMTKLEMLDLSDNELNISIFSSLAAVKSLRALYLDGNYKIEGSIPIIELSALNLEVVSLSACKFSGSLPYLGDWSSLQALSLAENDLNGTLTSKGLCRLKNLEELDLSGNNFTGNLPSCIGNLSSLMLVDLSDNQFQINFPSIFERLISLRYLSLSNNQLEGNLSIRSFLNHSNLKVLRLSTTALNFRVEVVNLPLQLEELELANCIVDVEPTFLYSQHKLRLLDLSNTRSRGPVPFPWLLENNTNLVLLNLRKNLFTGPLQLPILTHEKLSILDISDSCLFGELPVDIITKLPNLGSLNLSRNSFQGPLPHISISNLLNVDLSFNSLTDDIQNIFPMILPFSNFIDLSNNMFYGSLPNNMNYTDVSTLLLNDNNISGDIPFSICNASVDLLDISNNELNGVLPDCIGRAKFSGLILSGNHLEGSLPLEMFSMESLLLLDLSDNKLSGSIPPHFNHSFLQMINLSHNNLTGNFPITWLNMSYIDAIDIQDNHLSGELPIWIGNESYLGILQARQNLFGGHIPEQICQLKYLRILDLSQNNLFGQMPSCIIDMGTEVYFDRFLVISAGVPTIREEMNLGDVKFHLHTHYDFNMDEYYFIWNSDKEMLNFKVELISKRRSDSYFKKSFQLDGVIDLSSNKLVGNIPEEIGQMTWLITLNLSNNHFSGAIPNSMSNLSQLQSLDLSHNSLTGEIPRDMTKLTSLESFSVAYNNLSGPTLGREAQFITFDNSSYEGNPYLCGPPLSKSCFPTLGTMPPPPNEVSDDQRYEGTDFLILFGSFSLFFVVSFWGFIAVLYFKINWRYALFTSVDQYGDMIYVWVVLSARKIGAARTRRGN